MACACTILKVAKIHNLSRLTFSNGAQNMSALVVSLKRACTIHRKRSFTSLIYTHFIIFRYRSKNNRYLNTYFVFFFYFIDLKMK